MRKGIASLLCALSLLLSLAGCSPNMEPYSTTIFAMDTVMNLTVYADEKTPLTRAVDRLYEIENRFSVTKEDSDIHNINANCGQKTEVSEATAALLKDTLALCEKTGGALDITAYPAVKAWGFTTGEYRVVEAQERTELTGRIDHAGVELEGNTALLPAGMELDLGSVAKGYAGDVLVTELKQAGVTASLLDLGQSTIAAIGAKPDGKPWRIGIQDPAGDTYLGVLELNDQAMGSSGNYQRWFEENGVRYGHIIDPATAAPADSGLAGVSVVSESAFYCDGLSTALFVMGMEDAAGFWRDNRDFEAIFIEENGNITVTAGLKDSFSLADGYKDREVTVLE